MYSKFLFLVLRGILFITLFLCFSFFQAGAQGWLWAKEAGGANSEYGASVAATTSGNIYVTGYFNSPVVTLGTTTLVNMGSNDVFLVKYDSLGNVTWAKRAGYPGNDQASSVATDALGNVYLTGFFESDSIAFDTLVLANNGTRNAFIVKYDSAGHVLWAKQAGGTGKDEGVAVKTDNTGNVYVTGSFNSPTIVFDTVTLTNTSTDSTDNMFLVKYNSSGNFLWVRQGNGNHIEASSVATDLLGNVYAGGYFKNPSAIFDTVAVSNAGGFDIYLAKFTPAGNLVWAKSAGGTGDEMANSVITDAAGKVYVAGGFSSPTFTLGSTTLTGAGNVDVFLIKYDTTGSIIWAKGAGGSDSDYATSVITGAPGDLYLSGTFKSSSLVFGAATLLNAGVSNMFLVKYDTSGSVLLSDETGGTGYDAARSIAAGLPGNVYMTGSFGSPSVTFSFNSLLNPGNKDVFLAKFSDTAAVPGLITGILSVCMGSVTTLHNAIAGGTWTSSNVSIATAGGGTGIVNGIAIGTDTISYTIGSYTAIVAITVDSFPVPSVITGPSVVCMFSSITLSDAAAGGRWSSGGVYTTAAPGGVVTGVNAGLDTVSYIDSNSCGVATVTKPLTINSSPIVGAITGFSKVCQGVTISLSEVTIGGAWSASNTSGSVSGAGVVTGISGGIDTIRYSKTNFICTTTVRKVVTINPLPVAGTITGLSALCVGVTDTFTDSTAMYDTAGIWGTLTPVLLTVPAPGIARGVSAGTAIIGFTVYNGCGGATATKTITVLPLSNPGIITGHDSVCLGATITLTDTIGGGVWSLQNTNATDSAGILTGITGGTDTLYYATTNSCGTDSARKIITIVPLPYAAVILGDSGLCDSSSIVLTDSTVGGIWTTTNSIVSDSGGIVISRAIGVDTIIYTYTNMCGSASATKAITVAAYPVVGSIIGSADTICAGSSYIYHDSIPGGVWSNYYSGVSYVAGDGMVSGVFPGNDTIYYTVTNVCASVFAKKAITIMSLPTPGVILGPDTVCLMSNITIIATEPGGSWGVSDTNANVLAGVITGLVAGPDTVIYTITTYCGAAYAIHPFYIKPLPTVAAITGNDSLCITDTMMLFDATPSGTWSTGNPALAAVSGGIVSGITAGVDTIIYTCASLCGIVSAKKAVTIEPLPTPAIITGTDSVCIGDTTVLTPSVAGGSWVSQYNGIATVYAGKVKGISTGMDSIIYTVTNMCGSNHTTFPVKVLTTLSPAVTGRSFVCVGGVDDTLYGSPAGGVWTKQNPTTNITSLTGGELVTGVATGMDTITYSVTNVCGTASKGILVEVNAMVYPTLTGISALCKGKKDTIIAIPPGGAWSYGIGYDTITSIPVGGVVKCDSPGIDSIFYTVTNICGTGRDSINITIFTKAECDSFNYINPVSNPQAGIMLYPNPASGVCTIMLPGTEMATVSLIDILGNEVISNLINNHRQELNLDLISVKQGTYIVKIVYKEFVYREKLVIVR